MQTSPGNRSVNKFVPLLALLVTMVAAVVLVALAWPGGKEDAATSGGPGGAAPTIPASGLNRPEAVARQIERVDPRTGGWESEAFAEAADTQLKSLGKLLAHPEEIDQQHLAPLVADGFSCEPLRPPHLQVAFADKCLSVYRAADQATDSDPAFDDAAAALRELAGPFGGAHDVRVKFKIFRVASEPAPARRATETTAYYHAAGRFSQGTVEQTATWHCRWEVAEGEATPRLLSIRVEDYEEVVNRPGIGKWFVDSTGAVLSGNNSFREQMSYGIDHWRARIDQLVGPHLTAHHGLAVADVDGDGLEDLYVCQPTGLPNRLYLQNPDGTARDASVESGVDWLDGSTCAVFFDEDNDGDQDLFIATLWGLELLENDGAGHFRAQPPWVLPVRPAAMAVADYDQDGDVDLYICGYGRGGIAERDDETYPLPYQDANNGNRNFLLQNQGDWTFADVADEVGLGQNNTRWSLAASWEDYDNDGDLDLYVANDFGRNNLYRYDADRKQFKDVAAEAGVEDQASGMSVSWADFNHDGFMDVYISNMFSAAGSRVTGQPQFQPEAGEATIQGFRRLARGNTLFENAGDGTFRDVSQAAAVTMGRWAWASVFVDLNNDGLEDLFVVNGFVTQQDPGDL